MGMFTYVDIAKELLPEEYRGLSNWQTKEVVCPEMYTLEVTPDKHLYYHNRDRTDIINFTGDMCAYEFAQSIIYLDMKFINGELINITITEEEYPKRK